MVGMHVSDQHHVDLFGLIPGQFQIRLQLVQTWPKPLARTRVDQNKLVASVDQVRIDRRRNLIPLERAMQQRIDLRVSRVGEQFLRIEVKHTIEQRCDLEVAQHHSIEARGLRFDLWRCPLRARRKRQRTQRGHAVLVDGMSGSQMFSPKRCCQVEEVVEVLMCSVQTFLRSSTRRSGRRIQCAARKSRTAAIVAAGASSISQWPAFGTTTSWTFVAALRMTTATLAPKAFSAPMASTGIASFVSIALTLSASSFWPIARNWANAECIAPGLA